MIVLWFGSNENKVEFLSCVGYNFKLCVFKTFFVIWDFRTHMFAIVGILCFVQGPLWLMHPHVPLWTHYKSKGEDNKRRRSWSRSLVHNISGVEGRAGVPRWGVRRLTSNSFTHTDLQKPNNKLVSAYLEHFGARMSHM
jgi:hypothetical protein